MLPRRIYTDKSELLRPPSISMATLAKLALECLQDPLIWLFLASVATVIILRRRQPAAPLPPGPRPLPIIGNMTMADQLSHRGLAALAKQYGDLLHLRVGRQRVIAVTAPEHAREVLQAPNGAYSNRPATIAIAYLTYGRSDLVFAHGGAHVRRMRKLCATALFSRGRAETWLAVRDGYGAALARAVARRRGEAVNLGELVFGHTVRVIFRAAFSLSAREVDEEELDEFIAIIRVFSNIMGEFHIGDFFPWLGWMGRRGFNRRLHSARTALDRFIDKIIDDHIRRGKDPADADADLVDGLLALLAEANLASHKDTLRFTRDNVKAMIMDMFSGPETVTSTIEWVMSEMMCNPDTLLRLQRELGDMVGLDRIVDDLDLDKLPFLSCIVKETLRLHPPIPMLLHEAANDCILDGYSVPKGSRIMINMWAINRHPKAWKDGDTFRPSRFMPGEGEAAGRDLKGGSFEFMPFGSGRRSCPAQGLGLHAVKFAVAQLVHGFHWELPGGMKPTKLDMSDISGLTASRAKRLYVVPTTRLTCPL